MSSIPVIAGAATLALVTHVVRERFTPTGRDKMYLTTNDDGEIITFSLESFHTQITSAVNAARASAVNESKNYTNAEVKKVADAIANKRDFVGGSDGKWGGTHFPWGGNKQNYISGITHIRGDLRFGGFQLNESILIGMLQPCIIWEHDYHGHWAPFTRGDWNETQVRERHMNNRITAMWTGSFKVRLYDGNFSGATVLYNPQTWVPRSKLGGFWNDRMSSMKIRYPWENL